jgi:gas vesicle protein
MHDSGHGVGSLISFLLIGVGVGMALAALLTPQSGRELRGAIGRRYRRTVEGISEHTQDLRERGSNLLGINRGKTETQYRQG